MDFLKVITDRGSIRRFKQDTVPDEMIIELLDAARLAVIVNRGCLLSLKARHVKIS